MEKEGGGEGRGGEEAERLTCRRCDQDRPLRRRGARTLRRRSDPSRKSVDNKSGNISHELAAIDPGGIPGSVSGRIPGRIPGRISSDNQVEKEPIPNEPR